VKRMVILLLAAAVAVAALAQEKQPTDRDKTAAKLKSSKVGLIMIHAQLGTVLELITLNAGVEVSLDKKVDEKLRVSFDAENSTTAELLRMVLEPQELDYAIRDDGTVFVSKKEEIAKLKKEKEKEPGADLKEGELLLLLKDGSRTRGKAKHDKWTLKTAYGELLVPLDEITGIRLAGKHKAAKENEEETLTEDEVRTVRFTVTGNLEIDKAEVATAKGTSTIAKEKIKAVVFPEPLLDRWFQLKPTDKWVDTGIKVRKGDRLEIRAGAGFIIEKASFSPDGQVEPWCGGTPTYKEGCPLIARIGKKGWEFKTGKSYKAKAESEGNVYLKIHKPSSVGKAAEKAEGAYSVRVKVNK
jgi:hypothetical protein